MSRWIYRECRGEHCGCKTAHSMTWDDEGNTCYRCENCGKITRKRAKAVPRRCEDGMTNGQRKSVEHIREQLIAKHYGYEYREMYEMKSFEVTMRSGHAFLLAETGRVGDEGTMAAILCRRRVHVVIGPNGGVEVINVKPSKEEKAKGKIMKKKRGWFAVFHEVTE